MSQDPTPEQIAQAAAAIRAGWSARELAKRDQHRPPRWTAPEIEGPPETSHQLPQEPR
jgi:hypothetical protein